MDKFLNDILPFDTSINETIILVTFALLVFFLFFGLIWFIASLVDKLFQRQPDIEDEYYMPSDEISITVEDDTAVIAAISAAITVILEEEAAANGSTYNGFKIVSFKRASKGRPWTNKN